MARVMGSKGGGNDDEDIYGVTPSRVMPVPDKRSRRGSHMTNNEPQSTEDNGNIGKGTLIPVHMPVRARYSLNAFYIP